MHFKNIKKRFIRKLSFFNLKKKNYKLKIIYKSFKIPKINIFDIGAGQRIIPDVINFDGIGRVYLIDPNKNLNYAYNQLKKYFLDHKNIFKFQLGISDKSKKLTYYENNVSTGSTFAINKKKFKLNSKNYLNPTVLKVYSFIDFLRKFKLKKPDIIKIDVEGLELKVLKSILKCSDPFLVQIETNINNPFFSESFTKVHNLLIKKNYFLYTLYPSYGDFNDITDSVKLNNNVNLKDIEINLKKNYLLQAECYYLKNVKNFTIKHFLIVLGFGFFGVFKNKINSKNLEVDHSAIHKLNEIYNIIK
jgi:FkbM family methyltransferase